MQKNNKKIGLLGGTFNPIHKGHINIAMSALSDYSLDEVWFIPNGCPPHKTIENDVSAISRYNMVKCATEFNNRLYVKDIELNANDYNYTYITLKKLSSKYVGYTFFFIIGEDSLVTFDSWNRPDEICRYASILVAARSKNTDILKNLISEYSTKYNTNFLYLNCNYIDISSSDLRNMLKNNDINVNKYISENVLRYINEHFLYNNIDISDYVPYADIMDDLRSILKPKRYEHTLGVMHTAINLGMRYDIPIEVLRYAALLHDSAKSYKNDELKQFCENNNIPITMSEYKALHLLHGKVGAHIAKNKYHITDTRILDSIIYHTTGRANMTILEQIVFVADYIEPGRHKANRLDEIRHMAYYDINIATAMILQDTISYLTDTGAYIDDKTNKTYEYYSQLINK